MSTHDLGDMFRTRNRDALGHVGAAPRRSAGIHRRDSGRARATGARLRRGQGASAAADKPRVGRRHRLVAGKIGGHKHRFSERRAVLITTSKHGFLVVCVRLALHRKSFYNACAAPPALAIQLLKLTERHCADCGCADSSIARVDTRPPSLSELSVATSSECWCVAPSLGGGGPIPKREQKTIRFEYRSRFFYRVLPIT